jgi:flagellar hook-basal body complex protein FliE
MYIVPMSGITPLETISQNSKTEKASVEGSFADVFKQALQNVEETQRISQEDSIRVTLGEVDDLHTVQINAQKAAIALETFVSMKNAAVEAYNEIMRMNI